MASSMEAISSVWTTRLTTGFHVSKARWTMDLKGRMREWIIWTTSSPQPLKSGNVRLPHFVFSSKSRIIGRFSFFICFVCFNEIHLAKAIN